MEAQTFRSNEARRVTMVGFWVNALLTVFKLFAGFVGHSRAMIADGVHSLSDFLTDIIVLVGFKMTEKPEDECHNYGHGKFETLATVMISVFLGLAGLGILRSGVNNIHMYIDGAFLPKPGWIALGAAAVSIVGKEWLFRYTRKVGEKINSSAVTANAWHHRSDALSSVGTFFGVGGAIILSRKWIVLDPIASIIVSFFIFKVAYEICRPAMAELMEKALDREEIDRITAIIENHPNIEDHHRLRTRRIGAKIAVECHILVDPGMDIAKAHDVATCIEMEIRRHYGEQSIVTLHVEPHTEKEMALE